MELIDKGELYKRTAEWEEQAQAEVLKNKGCRTVEEWEEYKKWLIILNERSSFKYDIADAPTIEAEPRWIPIEQDCPEKGKDVLISHNGVVSIDWLTQSEGIGYFFVSGVAVQDIDAWMPLPEPYKEVEECD